MLCAQNVKWIGLGEVLVVLILVLPILADYAECRQTQQYQIQQCKIHQHDCPTPYEEMCICQGEWGPTLCPCDNETNFCNINQGFCDLNQCLETFGTCATVVWPSSCLTHYHYDIRCYDPASWSRLECICMSPVIPFCVGEYMEYRCSNEAWVEQPNSPACGSPIQ
jgi:hypothetical protein